MSFSLDTKNELARVQAVKPCCQQAELAALLRMSGTVLIGGGEKLGINFTTENAAVARKVVSFFKHGHGVRTEIVVSRARRLKKNNCYQIRIPPAEKVQELLRQLGFIGGGQVNMRSDRGLLQKACCRRAYLRGAFLGGGSVNRPERDYHLELVTDSQNFARSLMQAMHTVGLNARLTERKHSYIVYLKDGEQIISFLRVVGANNALLAFENVRVVKDMRNQVNRLVNCETANLGKTVNAALRQTEKIQRIDRMRGLESLPSGLRETAQLRLAHPEATLRELVLLHGGQITRSGMNHRLRKLEYLADQLGGKPLA